MKKGVYKTTRKNRLMHRLLAAVRPNSRSVSVPADEGDLITQQITIKLREAGTLPGRIGSRKKYKITNLKIIGEINGTDLRMIRDMAGRGHVGTDENTYMGDETGGKLNTLDLTEARIVSGGEYYYEYVYSFEGTKNSFIYYTSEGVIGSYAFAGCGGLVSLNLPSDITSIGDSAFYSCSGLTGISIPQSVTSLGDCLFYGCSGLADINIPPDVTSIGEAAFAQCSRLTRINIPSSVTAIGDYAFSDCEGLIDIYVSWETPLAVSNFVFQNADNDVCTLYVPEGAYQDYWLADGWGDFRNIVEYDGVTVIDRAAAAVDGPERNGGSIGDKSAEAAIKGVDIVRNSDGTTHTVLVK